MSLSFILRPLLDYAESHLPPAVYDILVTIFENIFAIYLYVTQYLPEGLQPQSILPLVISIFTLFLAVRSIYRSTIFAIRTAWWILKWSAIIGGIAYLFGWNQMGGNLQQIVNGLAGRNLNANQMENWMDSWFASPGSQPRRNLQRKKKAQSKRPKHRMDSPPTIFDSFEAHRAYAERKSAQEGQDRSVNTGEGDGNLEQIYEQVHEVWAENGKRWWETFGRLAGFVGDEEKESTQGRKRTRSKQRTR